MPSEPDKHTPDRDPDDLDQVRVPVTGNLPSSVLPKLDLFIPMPRISSMDEHLRRVVANAMPKPDFGKLFPDLTAHLQALVLPDLRTTLAPFFDRVWEWMPPNWPVGIDLDLAVTVFQDEGVPIVWVPRREVVEEMIAAPDRHARVKVLLSHTEEVVQDCRSVLAAVTHAQLAGQLPLVAQAVSAFADGHHGAAQALSTVVTETMVSRALPGKYADVRQRVLFDPDKMTLGQVRLRAALAPIGMFYTTWFPSSGTPVPVELSRHVTVHQADLNHYTAENAVVAVLLAASVVRALQEHYEDVDLGQPNL